MSLLIVVVGLGLVCVGALLSWHQKKALGIWATYVFGFLIVLTSGPISSGLIGFSVTEKGLDVKFTEVSPSASEIEDINSKTEQSIRSLSAAVSDIESDSPESNRGYSEEIVSKLIPFIRALGYTPTQIIGSPNIRPGSVVIRSEGKLSLWATQQEAFPNLATQKSSVAIPKFHLTYPVEGSEYPNKFLFECGEGALSEETSISGLMKNWNSSLSQNILSAESTYVVQSTLLCQGLLMASSQRGNAVGADGKQDFEFKTKENIVIGYKLAAVHLDKEL